MTNHLTTFGGSRPMKKVVVSFRIAKFFSIELVRRYGDVTVSGRSVGIVAGELVIDGTKPGRDTLRYDAWRGGDLGSTSRWLRILAPCGISSRPIVHHRKGAAHRSDDAQ